MKWMLFLFTLMAFSMVYADEVKVEINPPKPVAGEVFQAYFRVFTDADEEPAINFSPNGVEVVGKSNQGISTRTVYANGKLTVTREMTFVYDLVANKSGQASLRDINVTMGSKTVRHPLVTINILKEAEELADVFVMADVPKKNVYLGEGVVVRYYLYSKVPVSNLDVKKYPKLNNFLKRFLQEPERSERVSVDGQLYLRNQIYAAKLFPEKVGDLNIDSLHLAATYAAPTANDPFGSFGLHRDFKTKTIHSEPIKIEVKPLPEQGKPNHFTGLVGKHDFQIQFGQNKLIVNEPLEVKLTVSGGGALENLEAPVIIKHEGLEEFETNGDLKIASADEATKVFDYTFLAKENLKLPASTVTLSYFDPQTEKYVPVQLQVPEIVVAGGNGKPAPKPETPEETPQSKPQQRVNPVGPPTLAAPYFKEVSQLQDYLPYLNLVLAVLALIIAGSWFIKSNTLPKLYTPTHVPAELRKGNFNLSAFTQWLAPLIQKTGKSPLAIIRDSNLSEETKAYFVDLLNSNDYKDYSSRKAEMNYVYQASHFKNLSRYIESTTNENPS